MKKDKSTTRHRRLFTGIIFSSILIMSVQLNAQNVGIGTATPNKQLDVAGSVQVSDTIYTNVLKVAGGSPGDNKVLTSDANGLASWQTVTSDPSTSSDTSYPSVWICCQAWMTENLDVSTYRNGDTIPRVSDSTEWAALTTGAYCYFLNDSATYASVYGKLYNWYAINDPRGLAPKGWHVPTDFEWITAVSCLPSEPNAGGFLREIGTSHWAAPNDGASNITGFTALPGGGREETGGYFVDSLGTTGVVGSWWTSSAVDSTEAYFRIIQYDELGIFRSDGNRKIGCSVRCVKD